MQGQNLYQDDRCPASLIEHVSAVQPCAVAPHLIGTISFSMNLPLTLRTATVGKQGNPKANRHLPWQGLTCARIHDCLFKLVWILTARMYNWLHLTLTHRFDNFQQFPAPNDGSNRKGLSFYPRIRSRSFDADFRTLLKPGTD